MRIGPLRLLGLAVVAGLTTRVVRRRRTLAPVAPELRSPILYLPLDLKTDAVLAMARRGIERSTPLAAGVDVRTLGRTVHYDPVGRVAPSGALLWIHGGGLVMGHPKQANEFCSRIARELGVLVVSVDYRLAPEDPFPAGLDDCYDALVALHEQADELGVDPARIAVGGDSAGGGLAATVCQVARDRSGPPVCFQLLVYPMLDDRTVPRAERDGRNGLIWTAASNRYAWSAYLGHEPDEAPERPYASASRAEDLTGLPPAWLGVGDLDLFLEEDLEYARRLEAAGVPCEVHLEPGMYHGADAIFPGRPSMRAFRSRMVDALRPWIGAGAG